MLKIIFLFLGVWFTIVNFTKMVGRNDIPSFNFILQSIGIVGFLVLQFDLL